MQMQRMVVSFVPISRPPLALSFCFILAAMDLTNGREWILVLVIHVEHLGFILLALDPREHCGNYDKNNAGRSTQGEISAASTTGNSTSQIFLFTGIKSHPLIKNRKKPVMGLGSGCGQRIANNYLLELWPCYSV